MHDPRVGVRVSPLRHEQASKHSKKVYVGQNRFFIGDARGYQNALVVRECNSCECGEGHLCRNFLRGERPAEGISSSEMESAAIIGKKKMGARRSFPISGGRGSPI